MVLLITKREKKKIELLKERKQRAVACFQFSAIYLVVLRFTNGLLGQFVVSPAGPVFTSIHSKRDSDFDLRLRLWRKVNNSESAIHQTQHESQDG